MNHNIINRREYLSLPKDETNYNDSNNNDDTISHNNTINHCDICILKEDLNSYQIKCIKDLQNAKDAFLKKLSNIEQNLEIHFKKKTMRQDIQDTSISTGKRKLVFER